MQHANTRALVLLLTLLTTPTWAAPPTDLELEFVAGGLLSPVVVTHAGDGSGRVFIVEQLGRIQAYNPNTGALSLFLDISDKVRSGGEKGLLGLAFHPDYEQNGRFFVYYTEDKPGPPPGCPQSDFRCWNSVVERYEVSNDPEVADSTSAIGILRFTQDEDNHNGGAIHFGPDGYLYIASGDGGGGQDPLDQGQSLITLLGKMLRLDVDTPPAGGGGGEICGAVGNYTIPPDNPFVASASSCDEIWAYGLRNPWRFSFDRRTGDLWIGDVGQATTEEIDFAPAGDPGGQNYGWSCMEGHQVVNFNPCDGSPLTAPVWTYLHSQGCSITGGFRYRGSGIAGFDGTYLYADFCSGRIYFLTTPDHGMSWSSSEWMNTSLSITSFGEDEEGEVYVLDRSGGLYRVSSASTMFVDGFESGDVAAWDSAVP